MIYKNIYIIILLFSITSIFAQSNLYIKSDFGLQSNQSNIIDFDGNVNTIVYSIPDINFGINLGYIKKRWSFELGGYFVKSKLQHKLRNQINFFFSKRLYLNLNEFKIPFKIGYDIYRSKRINYQFSVGFNLNYLTDKLKNQDSIILNGIENYKDEDIHQNVPYNIHNYYKIMKSNKINYSINFGFCFIYKFSPKLQFHFNPYINFGLNTTTSTKSDFVFTTIDTVNNFTLNLYGVQDSFNKGDLFGLNFGIIYNFNRF